MRRGKRKKTGRDQALAEIKQHLDRIRTLRRSLRPEDLAGLGRRQPREPGLIGPRTERDFRERAATNGWRVSKRGWPDFILRKGSRVVFVEVKTYAGTALKDDQQQIAELLVTAGFEVFRWDPEQGFKAIGAPTGIPFNSGIQS